MSELSLHMIRSTPACDPKLQVHSGDHVHRYGTGNFRMGRGGNGEGRGQKLMSDLGLWENGKYHRMRRKKFYKSMVKIIAVPREKV